MLHSPLFALATLTLISVSDVWRPVTSQDGTQVFRRPIAGFLTDEVCATATLDAPPEQVWAVLADVAHFPEFMPYVTEVQVLARDATREGAFEQVEYHRLAPPLVQSRDYTLLIEEHVSEDRTQFVRKWRTANERGPQKRRDVVRVQVASGSWTLKRTEQGTTAITYKLLTEPGGNIPGWLANRANTTSLPRLMQAVRERSQQRVSS